MTYLLANEWAWFYFAACLISASMAFRRDSEAYQIIAAMLVISWAMSNMFVWTPYREAVFTGMDIVAGMVTVTLFWQLGDKIIGHIAGIYGLMILSHGLHPSGPVYEVALNLLFLAQVILVGVGAHGGRKRVKT